MESAVYYVKKLKEILKIQEDLSTINDLDSMLDRCLCEARRISRSDAGTIYLLEDDDKLRFGHVQNDTLFKDGTNMYIYSNKMMKIDEKSIAGYVAESGKTIMLDDAYDISPEYPFGFNKSFDEAAHYRTRSVLTVPLKINKQVIGVIQLINAKDDHDEYVPFTETDETFVTLFGNHAAAAIKEAQMTRSTILRMLRLAEVRDPKETAAHCNRVGSYAVDIYKTLARKDSRTESEIRSYCDILRIAAMIHDIGKVGIEDAILKKPGKLTDQEYNVIKQHTILGARLFNNYESPWDNMAAEIALNHHEKWNGKGYPGKIDPINGDITDLGVGKRGEEIPLSARIVALADVYDALISTRVYKGAWPEDKVIQTITDERGQHFDPRIVDSFLDCYDMIRTIRDRYIEKA